MIDLDQAIVPGLSAAGVEIGEPLSDVVSRLDVLAKAQLTQRGNSYLLGPVTSWVRENRIEQVGVTHGYRGKVRDTIGIGSTIAEVEAAFGPVVEDDEDTLIVPSMPGWCFDTSEWVNGLELYMNPQARIVVIVVFAARA